jgi:hypothetical protein
MLDPSEPPRKQSGRLNEQPGCWRGQGALTATAEGQGFAAWIAGRTDEPLARAVGEQREVRQKHREGGG